MSEDDKARNPTKSKVRAKVEHAIHVFKRQFDSTKARFKGLDKNAGHLVASCALVNLVLVRKRFIADGIGLLPL